MIASGRLSDPAMHPLFLPQVAPSPRELGSAGCSETSPTTWVVHSGVSPGADDNDMCGFDGGGSGFGCGGESRNRLVANAGVRLNGPSMSSAAAVDGQAPRGGQKADDWAYRLGGKNGGGRGGACASLMLRYGIIEYTVCMPVTLQNRD
jgi:hypothetical protein